LTNNQFTSIIFNLENYSADYNKNTIYELIDNINNGNSLKN